MVRLHEFEGKRLLKATGIPIPEGYVAHTPEEAMGIAERLSRPVVVKVQVWATGRLKAGGIRFANDYREAEDFARELLGSKIKGFNVGKVLVEERLNVAEEFYVGISVDDSYKVKAPVLIFSTEGGVEVEEAAKEFPERVHRTALDVLQGIKAEDVHGLVSNAGVSQPLTQALSRMALNMYELFRRYEARAVEINPLILTGDGKLYAADCRITIDDSAVPRHPELGIEVARELGRPATRLEQVAWKIEEQDYRGTAYFIQLVEDTGSGDYIGFHGIGGGGSMLGADALVRHGLKLANYADTSGNPTASKVYRIVKLILSQRGILGYTLMGPVIASQEQWHHARGVVRALKEDLRDKPGFPALILLAGNKEREALKILSEGLNALPIRLELYGRDHVYDVDYLAERMKNMVEEYKRVSGFEG